jgi:hypothetical protein
MDAFSVYVLCTLKREGDVSGHITHRYLSRWDAVYGKKIILESDNSASYVVIDVHEQTHQHNVYK